MRRRIWLGILAVLVLLLILACFPWGPLFPWSPWKPGYRVSHSARTDVYYPRGAELKDAYEKIESYISGAEKFLDLPAPYPVTVVVTRSWVDFERMMPHMRSRGLGGVTLATGTVIYITPKLDEKGFNHGQFLRHELTHAVMNQNQTLRNAVAVTKVEWISEGLCVSYGEQTSYFSRKEFLDRAAQEDLGPTIDPALRQPGKFDIRFAYPCWRYFTEFLMTEKGPGRFHNYVHAVMSAPEHWRTLFEEVLGQKFEAAIAEFQAKVRRSTE